MCEYSYTLGTYIASEYSIIFFHKHFGQLYLREVLPYFFALQNTAKKVYKMKIHFYFKLTVNKKLFYFFQQ